MNYVNPDPQNLQRKTIRLIALGVTGTGKSTFINTLYLLSHKISCVKDISSVLIASQFYPDIYGTTNNKAIN